MQTHGLAPFQETRGTSKRGEVGWDPRKGSLGQHGAQAPFVNLHPQETPVSEGGMGVWSVRQPWSPQNRQRSSCQGRLPGHCIVPFSGAWHMYCGQPVCAWGPKSSQPALILTTANNHACRRGHHPSFLGETQVSQTWGASRQLRNTHMSFVQSGRAMER